jgi:hypothetical protein
MQKVAPKSFVDPRDMDETQFAELQEHVKARSRAHTSQDDGYQRRVIEGLDSFRMSDEENDALSRHMRDRAQPGDQYILEAAKARLAS